MARTRVARDPAWPWHVPSLGIPELWSTTRGDGVTVALIDSGVARVAGLEGASIARLDEYGSATTLGDGGGHGTRCASLIVSTLADTAGIAPRVELLSYRTTNTAGEHYTSKVANALADAATRADLISCSFCLDRTSPEIGEALALARERGVAVVAAAGNEAGADTPFPLEYPDIIIVAGLTADGRALPDAAIVDQIDVGAPGEELVVLSDQDGETDSFGLSSGATAIVSAVCALMLSLPRTIARRRKLARMLQELIRFTGVSAGAGDPPFPNGARALQPVRLFERVRQWLHP
jgi:serine protease